MNRIVRTAHGLPARQCLFGIALLLAAPQAAQATWLVNDGWSDGQPVEFQEGFVAGEIGAARFLPAGPCPCYLKQISFLYGGAAAERTVRLHIWEDGAGAWTPGPELFSRDYLLSGAGDALQIVDLSGEGIFVNGAFRVGFEFLDAGPPSIARDTDGNIQAGANFIYNELGIWADSSLFGLTGDWVIRVEVEENGNLADEVKNDSWPPSLAAHFQGGFLAGESAAVRMVPPGPCPCVLNGVNVLIGGAPGSADFGLRIWDDSALTTSPGSLIYSDNLELASAGAAMNIIPLALEQIVVDGPFRLGFEMLQAGFPSVARDDDGITAGVNFIDEASLGWVDAAGQGLSGDWIMRAVVTNKNLETAALGYDDWDSVSLPVFQDGFTAGEMAAVRLEPGIPCPCVITDLRLMFGGAGGDSSVILRIWDDVGTLEPGIELYSSATSLEANDLSLNRIALTPAGVPVNGPFRIGIEFSSGGVPSVARDHDGTVPGRNFIYDEGGNWADATTQGVPGDWIIRAIVVPQVLFESGFE